RARNHTSQALRRVFGNDPDYRFQITVTELHTFRAQLRVVLDQTLDELDLIVIAVDCEIILTIDMNLNFEEGLEIFDVSVVRSEKLGDTVADSNAFLHPYTNYNIVYAEIRGQTGEFPISNQNIVEGKWGIHPSDPEFSAIMGFFKEIRWQI